MLQPILTFWLIWLAGAGAQALVPRERGLSSPVEGLWVQHCQAGVRRSEAFSGPPGAAFTRMIETYHFDRDCRQAGLSFWNDGRSQLRPGQIDFEFTAVRALPHAASVAADLNRRRVCGSEVWVAGSAREVTGLACDFFGLGSSFPVPSAGLRRYGIWKVEVDRLSFGLLTPELDASTPAKRPREWDSRPYHRVPGRRK